jgi:hypothetical protein
VTYAFVGQAEAPQGKADVIDVKGEGNFGARLFIDAQTHLPLMLTWQAAAAPPRRGGPPPGIAASGTPRRRRPPPSSSACTSPTDPHRGWLAAANFACDAPQAPKQPRKPRSINSESTSRPTPSGFDTAN